MTLRRLTLRLLLTMTRGLPDVLLDEPEAGVELTVIPNGVSAHERVCDVCWLVTQRRPDNRCRASYACSDDYVQTYPRG